MAVGGKRKKIRLPTEKVMKTLTDSTMLRSFFYQNKENGHKHPWHLDKLSLKLPCTLTTHSFIQQQQAR